MDSDTCDKCQRGRPHSDGWVLCTYPGRRAEPVEEMSVPSDRGEHAMMITPVRAGEICPDFHLGIAEPQP